MAAPRGSSEGISQRGQVGPSPSLLERGRQLKASDRKLWSPQSGKAGRARGWPSLPSGGASLWRVVVAESLAFAGNVWVSDEDTAEADLSIILSNLARRERHRCQRYRQAIVLSREAAGHDVRLAQLGQLQSNLLNGFRGAFIAALSGEESEFASPRVLGVAQWAAIVALSLLLAALLLAWGATDGFRLSLVCHKFRAPGPAARTEACHLALEACDFRKFKKPAAFVKLSCPHAPASCAASDIYDACEGHFSLLPNAADGDASLQQPGSTPARLKAIALAFSYASLGVACFWAALGAGLALEVLRKEQDGGLPALAAFVACLAVACLALAAIASLLLTSLKRQEVHEADLRMGEVDTWRMDPLSKLEEWLAAQGKGFQSRKAEALSTPVVITLQVFMERALFVWDIASDVLVAIALLEHHPWWASITAGIMCLPYLALSCLLGACGVRELLAQLFPSTCAELPHVPCCCLALPPSFVFIDFTFVFQHIAWEPASTRLFHYWTLRQLLEVFLEANLQTALQGYIFFRQENFFNVFPALENTSVNPVLLAVSLASSARASVNGLTKLSSFARLQTHGSKWEFFQAMLVGGGGLAPSHLLQELRQRANVEISQDLSASVPCPAAGGMYGAEELSLDGFTSLCLAARESVTLRRLRMEAAFLEKFAGTDKSVDVENAIAELFANRQLLSVELDNVPAAFQERVADLISKHPRLEEGPGAQGLRELPAGIRFFLQGEAAEPGCPLVLLREVFSAESEAAADALRLAAFEGQASCVEVLLVAKADANAIHPQNGFFSLLLAAQLGHASCVELLLKAGAEACQVNSQRGIFPLLMAAQDGHASCVELLLKAGAEAAQVDPQVGGFPLLMAAQHGHASCMELLLKAGADAAQVNSQSGAFPLLMAAQNGHASCVELLLKAGAEACQVYSQSGAFPLLMAAQIGHASCVELLLKGGAKAAQVDSRSGTFPLLMAAENGHASCVELLLKAGAEACQVNSRNGTFPLLVAAHFGHASCVELLLRAAMLAPEQLQKAAAEAEERGHAELAERLRSLCGAASPPKLRLS
ncbi:secG [Symbiodinium sp. CCMP2592]|nr:secG [Symbiodinium sp. CCMP2592]